MTQAHQFRTRGNIRLKPAVKRALGSSGGGGQGGGAIQQPGRLGHAARERKQLNRDLDRRGYAGGQAAGEAGSDTSRAFKRR
jgi:hypothetical protein